jgi:Glutamine amidotransferase class-I
MSHGDQLAAPPPDFHIIGHTKSAPYAAIAHNAKPIYGIQFHPEVTHSPRGKEVIARFVHGICGCKSNWTMVRTSIYSYIFYVLARGYVVSSHNDARRRSFFIGGIRREGNCSYPRNLW